MWAKLEGRVDKGPTSLLVSMCEEEHCSAVQGALERRRSKRARARAAHVHGAAAAVLRGAGRVPQLGDGQQQAHVDAHRLAHGRLGQRRVDLQAGR